MDANRLKEIKERLNRATPGEWKLSMVYPNCVDIPEVNTVQAHGEPSWEYENDLGLIAHAPQDLRDLLAYVEEERIRSRKYREALALILPLAKGYAAEHPVGSNQKYLNEVVELTEGGEGMSNKQNDDLNEQALENQLELILSCRKAMWWGDGMPAGLCNKPAYGPGKGDFSYVGTCCRNHGGPDSPDGVIVEKDGNAWCAHYSNFINLQESDAEFGDTPDEAIENLLKKHIKS